MTKDKHIDREWRRAETRGVTAGYVAIARMIVQNHLDNIIPPTELEIIKTRVEDTLPVAQYTNHTQIIIGYTSREESATRLKAFAESLVGEVDPKTIARTMAALERLADQIIAERETGASQGR